MSEITVVIPCFNLGEFVGEAVDSVLSQQEVNAHVILVDDGSNDEATIRNVDKLGTSENVKLIRTDNRGVASARNTGLTEAQGKYICFLDADDRLLPGALKTMVDALDENEQAALAYPAFRRMGTGESVHRPAWNRLALLYTNILSIASLVRRSAIGTARFRTTERGFEYEDWDFWLQLTEDAPALHIPEVLYQYRSRNESRGKAGNRHHDEVIADLRKLNAESFSAQKLMDLKRRCCPAVSIVVDQEETYKKWQEITDKHPYMDTEILHTARIPREGIDRRERMLGKYILRDLGKSEPDFEVFVSALKAFENFEHLYYLPEGWAFSLREDMGLGLDPTSRLAHQFASENNLDNLSRFDERLWRLSCPAWYKARMPDDPEDPAGENGRAKHLVNMLSRLNLIPYAIFGAGQHTKRLLGKDIFNPKPEVVFDDNPQDESIEGIRVEKPDPAADIHAMIISSDAHELKLYKRALEIFPRDVPILRFYS